MRYFVTGATGFIGARLVRQLRAAGHEVRALVRSPSQAQRLAALGATLHHGDITDQDTMRAAMSGADGVFHLAAWYRIGAPRSERRAAERINVHGTRTVLELMRELGIPKGVYTSTLAVFGDTHGWMGDESYRPDRRWLSEYDRTKWKAHYEVAVPLIEAGLPLVIVQPGVVYGPGDPSAIGSLLRQYLRRTLPAVPKGTTYCWGYVDDTVQGHVQAMEKGRAGESYILGGPPHTLEEALEIAERITGIRPPRLRLPAGLLRGAAAAAGLLERIIPLPETYSAETLRVGAGVTYLGSSEKAQLELGWSARGLEEGLRETLAYEMRLLGRQDAGVTIRPAVPGDLRDITALLEQSALPREGLPEHLGTTLVAQAGGRVVGCAAVELYGAAGLLRSVAVDRARRGEGLGHRLTQAALDLARARGVKTIYLLTTTAGGFFPRFGFRAITRDQVDPAVRRSVEFTTACPASATVMALKL